MIDNICLVQMSIQYSWQYIVQMSVQYTWHYMFSSNECTIYLTLYVWFKWVYNILDNVYVSSNECTIYLTLYVYFKWVYNILDTICLVQMNVQYTWHYMFGSNECTIYLTMYMFSVKYLTLCLQYVQLTLYV